jgi:hypothetical protein
MHTARPSAGTKISSRQAAKGAKKARPDLCLALGDLRVFAPDISPFILVAYDVASELFGNDFQLLRVSSTDKALLDKAVRLTTDYRLPTTVFSHQHSLGQNRHRYGRGGRRRILRLWRRAACEGERSCHESAFRLAPAANLRHNDSANGG